MKYYLDTAIWMDLYEDRKGYKKEPLGHFALKLFSLIRTNKHKMVISDLLIHELELNYSLDKIRGMVKPFEDLIEKLVVTTEQRDEAEKIARERNVPRADATHAILARDNKLILITRDKHFKQLEDVSKHYKPEDII